MNNRTTHNDGQTTPTKPSPQGRGSRCHPEEGLKYILEDKPCSGSRRRANTEKAMWKTEYFSRNQKSYCYLVSNEMLKRVQHDNFWLLKGVRHSDKSIVGESLLEPYEGGYRLRLGVKLLMNLKSVGQVTPDLQTTVSDTLL